MTAWTLALETVATAGSVALLQGDTLHSERQLPPAARSARTLTAVIQDLWNVAGKPKIQLIGVASGPGSFTGLRVGITTAKTLAFAWNAKLIGINTLEAIADQIEPVAGWLHVALDAQRKELFLARFCADGKGWRREASDTIITLQSWLESLANSTPSHPIAVAGPRSSSCKIACRPKRSSATQPPGTPEPEPLVAWPFRPTRQAKLMNSGHSCRTTCGPVMPKRSGPRPPISSFEIAAALGLISATRTSILQSAIPPPPRARRHVLN